MSPYTTGMAGFHAIESGSRLKVTEQGVLLDGYEAGGSREHGARALIERMAHSL